MNNKIATILVVLFYMIIYGLIRLTLLAKISTEFHNPNLITTLLIIEFIIGVSYILIKIVVFFIIIKITSELLDLNKDSHAIMQSIVISLVPLILLSLITLYYILLKDSHVLIFINDYHDMNLIPYIGNSKLAMYQNVLSAFPIVISPFILRDENENIYQTLLFVVIPFSIILFFHFIVKML